MEKIRAALLQASSLTLPFESIGEDENLFETGLSSFDLINLIMILEESCGIEFSQEAMRRENFATIAKIHETLAAARGETPVL